MYKFNEWHPLPRYGLAAALHMKYNYTRPDEALLQDPQRLAELATHALKSNKFGFLLRAVAIEGADASRVHYQDFNDVDLLQPGKASGQNSANGYFLAPHVLTSNDSAKMIGEVENLIKALAGSLQKDYQLKRSFSPLTTKINAGTKSMSDPKDTLLEAAFTAVATSTPRKAAALDFDAYTNIGLIPDIALYDETSDSFPLLDYLNLLSEIQSNLGEVRIGKYDTKTNKYGSRPPYYRGNFREALNFVEFGSLQLLAAVSGLLREGNVIEPDLADRVLRALSGRPLHIVGYDVNRQEQFGSHLISLTQDGSLYQMLRELWKVDFYDGSSLTSPRGQLFRRYLDRWLRRYSGTEFRSLLAVRATYPFSFYYPFKSFFMNQGYSPEIIESALALGRSINRAAYFSAKQKEKEDKRTGRDTYEYKARVLAALESNIRSATSAPQLLSQISTLVGRITNSGLDAASQPFMRALVEKGEHHINLKEGQDLIVAFMRLNQPNEQRTAEVDNVDEESSTSEDDSSSY